MKIKFTKKFFIKAGLYVVIFAGICINEIPINEKSGLETEDDKAKEAFSYYDN